MIGWQDALQIVHEAIDVLRWNHGTMLCNFGRTARPLNRRSIGRNSIDQTTLKCRFSFQIAYPKKTFFYILVLQRTLSSILRIAGTLDQMLPGVWVGEILNGEVHEVTIARSLFEILGSLGVLLSLLHRLLEVVKNFEMNRRVLALRLEKLQQERVAFLDLVWRLEKLRFRRQ